MSQSGWKYRCYADEPETPVADFLCALLGGTIGSYNFFGWVLVYMGWLSIGAALTICVAFGLLLGAWLAYENLQARAKKP